MVKVFLERRGVKSSSRKEERGVEEPKDRVMDVEKHIDGEEGFTMEPMKGHDEKVLCEE